MNFLHSIIFIRRSTQWGYTWYLKMTAISPCLSTFSLEYEGALSVTIIAFIFVFFKCTFLMRNGGTYVISNVIIIPHWLLVPHSITLSSAISSACTSCEVGYSFVKHCVKICVLAYRRNPVVGASFTVVWTTKYNFAHPFFFVVFHLSFFLFLIISVAEHHFSISLLFLYLSPTITQSIPYHSASSYCWFI